MRKFFEIFGLICLGIFVILLPFDLTWFVTTVIYLDPFYLLHVSSYDREKVAIFQLGWWIILVYVGAHIF